MRRALVAAVSVATSVWFGQGAELVAERPEERAIAYLAREVPRWSGENKCFSCHNNGDAARALMIAVQAKRTVSPAALADTLRFLSQPEDWDKNGPEGPFKDKRLARVQFASALATAVEAGLVTDKKPLARAAELLMEIQAADGSWSIDGGDQIGSPVTYGQALLTATARRVLQQADPQRCKSALEKSHEWLLRQKPANVLEAAAIMLALDPVAVGDADKTDVKRLIERCLEQIRSGESRAGGWGPYVTSPPEPFDTALVLLALVRHPAGREAPPLIKRGRAYLVTTQHADGSWPETTRPAGAESYAQRLSTTGWVTMVLLESRGVELPAQPRLR